MITLRHSRSVLLLATTMALFLAGCKVGKDYKGTGVVAPNGYQRGTAAADTTALAGLAGNDTLDWWRLFQDPVLDTLIREALVNNRDLNTAILNIDRAATLLAISKANIAPKFDLQGNYTYGNYPILFDDDARSSAFGGASVAWELDIWGKIRRQNEAARADLLGQQYAVRAVQLELISAVASTYFELLEYRTDLDISRRTYNLRDSMYLIINARFQAGIAAEIDLDQARIQRAIAATSIPIQERRIAFTENTLSVLMGRPPGRIDTGASLADQPAVPEIPVGLPSELLQRRPDVLASEQEVIAQNALTGAAFAQRFPTLSLTGLLGVASTDLAGFTSGSTAYSLSGGLLGPLFHWGQNRRRVEVERIRTEQTVLQYEQTVLLALRDVEDALIAIKTLKDEQVAREAHVRAALHAEFLSKERYDKGVTSYLESLESQRQAFESQLGLAAVQRTLLTSYVRLYKALGGGWPTAADKKAAASEQE